MLFFAQLYTGCPRRKGPNFGRVFLRSNCTDITQNTYIQCSMVTEILAREKCGLLWCLRTVLCPWRHTRDGLPLLQLHSYVIARCSSQRPWLRIRFSHFIVVGSQWTSTTSGRIFPLNLDNGQSTHVYINQRLQTQFKAPDDERCAARNMLSLQ
jgi:hypothetical protein